ncbi:MAG: transglutaminase domain-containing protein [Calditrichaeota bacterium]|nr:transglutaminase domain-containing protein [Calditrichota bacterium]
MRYFRLIIVLGFGALLFNAQSLKAQDEFQKWLKKDQDQYKQFVEKEDREFSEFLKKDWEAFLTQQGVKFYSKPKPKKMPVAKEEEKPKPKAPPKKIEKLPPPPPKPRPVIKERPAPTPGPKPLKIDYYGQQILIPFSETIKLNLTLPINNEKISKVWTTFAAVKQDALIKQLKMYKQDLNLNGWGFLQLVHKTARTLTANDRNAATAYTWFLMNKLGYNAKIAFKTDRLFLLIPTQNLIYEQPFVLINKEKFYFISFDDKLDLSGKVFTYRGNYKNADKRVSLSINKLPNLMRTAAKKSFTFKFKGTSYSVPVEYDGEVVKFFKKYPQTEIKLYFTAPASGYLSYSLLNELRPLVKGKNELEAANLLLRFVQTAFNYKTDDQQFGHEKYMLPDETIYYPSSDCEDRAILFAYLVRNLLGLEVIGLDYPNHIATGVLFHSEIPGKSVLFQGKRYVLCDPTYINADAGMVMPELKDIEPKVISF